MLCSYSATALVLSFFCLPLNAAPAAEDVPSSESKAANDVAEQIKGEWVLYRETPNGRYTTIKQHHGDQTVVTTYDPQNNAIQSHRSEYHIEADGNVPIFRYRNKVVLVGPNAGEKDESESAYLFRIEGEEFYEVRGMLPGDRGRPSLIVWKRLKENLMPKLM